MCTEYYRPPSGTFKTFRNFNLVEILTFLLKKPKKHIYIYIYIYIYCKISLNIRNRAVLTCQKYSFICKSDLSQRYAYVFFKLNVKAR